MVPFDLPGRFWRGNLHTHSDRSDGALPPEQIVETYSAAGYDFLSITDHFKEKHGFPLTRAYGDLTMLLGAELHAPRTAASEEWHIVAVGLPPDFAPPAQAETGPEMARRARAAGAFIGMAHPHASLLTLADAESLDAAHSVEIYNVLAEMERRSDSLHLYDTLLSRGHRLTAYAADDAHFRSWTPPPCRAWVNVRATSPEPTSLLAALRAGHFYPSTGPEIHSIGLKAGTVTVECSAAAAVMITGAVPGYQIVTGDGLSSCSLPLAQFEESSYVRVTVVDGSDARAWSQPIWLDRA